MGSLLEGLFPLVYDLCQKKIDYLYLAFEGESQVFISCDYTYAINTKGGSVNKQKYFLVVKCIHILCCDVKMFLQS